jgi:plastocyanin
LLHRRLLAAVAAAALAAAALPAVAGASSGDSSIEVQDRCDPATFDAVLGEGACAPISSSGGTLTFDEFIARVTKDHQAGGWRFSRDKVTIRSGESLDVRLSRGGELHTFTEVPSYGNGCVELLNMLVFPGQDPTPPAKTCADAFPAGQLPPTAVAPVRRELTVSSLAPGVHRFMCLIHPWMRTTVAVR